MGGGLLLNGETMQRIRQMRRTAIFNTFLGGRAGGAGDPRHGGVVVREGE